MHLWEISNVYDNDDLWEISPTLVLVPGAVFNEIVEAKYGSAGFKNQGALEFIQTKLYSHHETYSGDPRATSRQGFV